MGSPFLSLIERLAGLKKAEQSGPAFFPEIFADWFWKFLPT
jgi:hypothetical protein